MKRFCIKSEVDTARIAQALVSMVQGGASFGLSGELGAGKTTFVRYLITTCGGDARAVASPTYTLQHEYPLPNGLLVEHWDLYRVTTLPLELEERASATVMRLIEWPERCPEIKRDLTCILHFSHGASEESDGGERILEVQGICEDEITKLLNGVVNAL